MGLARFNHQAMRSLADLASEIRVSRNVLIMGLQQDHIVQPWTPFTYSAHLRDNHRLLHETVFYVVGKGYYEINRDRNDRGRIYIEDLRSISLSTVDLVLVFGTDGAIWRVIKNKDEINLLTSLNWIDHAKTYSKEYWRINVDPLIGISSMY